MREGEQEYTVRFGWDGDRQCAEAFGQRLRTTVYEPGASVPWLRLEQDCEPDSPELLQVRQAMAAEDQPLPAQCFPALGAPRIGFFHTDHIGTPLRLSDEQGRTLWQAEADDWRAITGQNGSTDQPLRFQGQYHDLESDLYYNRYRYYLPELGRYATQDPIGLRGGPNLYVYALNVPSVAYDPTGLFVPLLVIGAFALRGVIGAGIELGVQAGKQVLGQVKDNWDNDRELTDIKWKCIDINWKHVAVSGAVSTVAPGMLTTGKNVLTSAKALKTLNGQAANTANRAAKLAARKAAHSSKNQKCRRHPDCLARRKTSGQVSVERRRRGVPGTMKRMLLMTAIFIPLALLYNVLTQYFGETWLVVGAFCLLLVALRVGLYLYRRSRGIKDNYLDE